MATPENTIADPTKVQTATTYAAPATAPAPAIAPTAPKTATAAPSTTATTTRPPSTMAPKPAAAAPAFVKPTPQAMTPARPANSTAPSTPKTIAPAVARPTIAPAVARPTIAPAVARPTIAQPIAQPDASGWGRMIPANPANPQGRQTVVDYMNRKSAEAEAAGHSYDPSRAFIQMPVEQQVAIINGENRQQVAAAQDPRAQAFQLEEQRQAAQLNAQLSAAQRQGILAAPAQDLRAKMEQANLEAQNAEIMFKADEENRARVLATQLATAQAQPAPTIGSPVQTIFPGPAPRTLEQVNPQGRGQFDNPRFVHPTQPGFIRPAQPNGPPLSRIPNSGPGRAPVVAPAPAPAIPMTTLPAVANANRGRGRAINQINQIRAQQGRAELALAPGHSAEAKAINAAKMAQARVEAGLPPGSSPRFGATMIKAPRRRGGR